MWGIPLLRGRLFQHWLENTEVKTPITNYVSINFAQNIVTAWEENSLSSVHNDYTTNENKKIVELQLICMIPT